MAAIIQPARVLIDTNHLIEMARLLSGKAVSPTLPDARRDAYATLIDSISSGECTLLFYEPQSYEWVRENSDERAREITSVFGRAQAVKTLPVDEVLFRIEALNEASRVDSRLRFPRIEPVRDFGADPELSTWFCSTFPELASGVDSIPVVASAQRGLTVDALTQSMARHVRAHTARWSEAIDGHSHALEVTRMTQAAHPTHRLPAVNAKRHWLRTALGVDEVIQRQHPEVDAGAVLEQMDMANCPAVSLTVDVLWRYAQSNRKSKDSDVIDLTLVAPMPYADFVLTEGGLAELVRQSNHSKIAERVHRDPCTFVADLKDR